MSLLLKLTSALLILCLASCNTVSLKEYYYPLNIEDGVAVYEYVNIDNPRYSEYWKVITDEDDETLITESYHSDFSLYNTFYEEFTEEGALLTDYVDYEKDKEGREQKILAKINDQDVFKWDKTKSYNFSVDYVNKFGRFTFTKVRTNLGFEKIIVKDEEYKAVKFRDEYFVHAIDQEDKYSFYQISYYAKGVGMIKYERYIPNSDVLILELENVLTTGQFNQKKAEAERKAKEKGIK